MVYKEGGGDRDIKNRLQKARGAFHRQSRIWSTREIGKNTKIHLFKARCWEPPGHFQCTPGPGRLGCVISIEIGVNGEAYPVAISQKVTKNLPVSFYSPMPGFKTLLRPVLSYGSETWKITKKK